MSLFQSLLADHQRTLSSVEKLAPIFTDAAQLLTKTLNAGNKILLCGNGGSAADAQHIAAEIVGRFETPRAGLPAIALTTDSSILTAAGNDFGFEHIFARQVAALGQAGDVLIAYSTSGNSANVLEAARIANDKNLAVIALCGGDGGALAPMADAALVVASDNTARIQEAHAFLGHALCAAIDAAFPA